MNDFSFGTLGVFIVLQIILCFHLSDQLNAFLHSGVTTSTNLNNVQLC